MKIALDRTCKEELTIITKSCDGTEYTVRKILLGTPKMRYGEDTLKMNVKV